MASLIYEDSYYSCFSSVVWSSGRLSNENAFTVDNEAILFSAGNMSRCCSVCGARYVEVLPEPVDIQNPLTVVLISVVAVSIITVLTVIVVRIGKKKNSKKKESEQSEERISS